MRGTDTPERLITPRRLELAFALLGCAGLVAAVVLAPHDARAAAAQGWPPFVLVSGLLLVGLVANEDGLFAAGGHALTRLAPGGVALYAGTAVLVVSVTTLLNLDTSVTFLTPVLVYAARSRGEGEAPLLYACAAALQRRLAAASPAGSNADEPDRARPPPPSRVAPSSPTWRRGPGSRPPR